MWIFKLITDRYCQKLLEAYQLQSDEKLYKGKEADLLIQRNEFARCLVGTIKQIEANNNDDIAHYFSKVLIEINKALKDVKDIVSEHNSQFKTEFTTDLFESFFTPALIASIKMLEDLIKNSPSIITDLMDESLLRSTRNVPWVYQFSSVLYEYILEREFDFIVNKSERDIFDEKKQLALKYIQKVADHHALYENENDAEYRELMDIMLQGMRSQEHDLQHRKSQEPTSSNFYSYFTQTVYQATYKASEKLMGKGQLGQSIDLLIKEFTERGLSNPNVGRALTS